MQRAIRRAATLIAALALIAPQTALARSDVFRLFNLGCNIAASQAHGCFSTSMKGPGFPGKLARGSRQGKACGWNLLALISVGDVRIQTAMADAGITEIASVDYYAFELIPLFYGFSRYCTIVTGE